MAQRDLQGSGGFTTQDNNRSQITARAVTLVYNWWSWYVRAAIPQARRKALTNRPLLLAALGRVVNGGNQTTPYLAPLHAKVGLIRVMIANVHAAIQHVRAIAEQLVQGGPLDHAAGLHLPVHRRPDGLPVPPPVLPAAS